MKGGARPLSRLLSAGTALVLAAGLAAGAHAAGDLGSIARKYPSPTNGLSAPASGQRLPASTRLHYPPLQKAVTGDTSLYNIFRNGRYDTSDCLIVHPLAFDCTHSHARRDDPPPR